MAKTEIGWTWRVSRDKKPVPGYTFNPWWGCLKVSEECEHCYALDIAHHYGHNVWGPTQTTDRRFFGEKYWAQPLSWDRQAEKAGLRRSIFCASMADVFERAQGSALLGPLDEKMTEARERLWKLIEVTPNLDWMLLTKRPQNVLGMVPWIRGDWPMNVLIGTSVGTQARVNERLPYLVKIPARYRFLSCEPLLEEIDLKPWLYRLHWVIVGGESGPDARPMKVEWAQKIRDQCATEQIPFFFKQWGGKTHNSGGRMLDGRYHAELPFHESGEKHHVTAAS